MHPPGRTWRVRGRTSFTALRRSPCRGRSGPLSVSWVDDGTMPARVAFAVGRWAGNAVARNRIRRRLRAAVADDAGSFESGLFLVSAGASAADLAYDDLRAHLVGARRAARPRTAEARR